MARKMKVQERGSVKYSRIDLQINSLLQFIPFHLVPFTGGVYLITMMLDYLPPQVWWSWLVYPVAVLPIGFAVLLCVVLLVGLAYRITPNLEAGKRYKTYSKEWLLWGIKAELWKVVVDFDFLYNYILKIYSLRWIFFKLIGFKIKSSSMVATDVRIYEPHMLEVGHNVLLPVYSLFSGHAITGATMVMGKIKIGDDCRLGAQSTYGPGVTLGHQVTIGFNVVLGPGSQVGDSSLIDSGTKVAENCKIGKDVSIGKDCVIDRRAEIADGVQIPSFTRIRTKRKINSTEELFSEGKGDRRVGNHVV
jgi:acetyltransferase-like isoleucine patch superfamily enzyme